MVMVMELYLFMAYNAENIVHLKKMPQLIHKVKRKQRKNYGQMHQFGQIKSFL